MLTPRLAKAKRVLPQTHTWFWLKKWLRSSLIRGSSDCPSNQFSYNWKITKPWFKAIFKNWYSNYLPFQFPLSWFVMLSIWLSWFFCALALAASLLSSSLLFGKYENYSLTSFLLTFSSLLFELLLFWQHQRKAEKIEKLRVLGFIPRCQWALNVELTCIWNYDIFLPRSFWANWVVFLKATQANKKYPSSPFSLLKLFLRKIIKNETFWVIF